MNACTSTVSCTIMSERNSVLTIITSFVCWHYLTKLHYNLLLAFDYDQIIIIDDHQTITNHQIKLLH